MTAARVKISRREGVSEIIMALADPLQIQRRELGIRFVAGALSMHQRQLSLLH
jgi:hypothetical protein